MGHTPQKHMGYKILVAFLPTIIFFQNYSMMTGGKSLGWAFLIIWLISIWSVSQFNEKNHISERLFRLTEIAFFMLPVSALVLTFVVGYQSVSSTSSSAGQAGAAIGSAIGGAFAMGISFFIGITAGFIFHIIANKYEKKAEASAVKQAESLPNQHGTILSLLAVIVLAIILGSISGGQKATSTEGLKSGATTQTTSTTSTVATGPKVDLEITKKSFSNANYTSIIRMDLKFTNNTDKDVKGVEGMITYYDIFDNKITAVNIAYDEGILKNSSKEYKAAIDFNQFISEDVKLRDTDLKNLKYKWDIKTIIYEDGTKESF